MGCTLARISILPKTSRIWLFAQFRLIVVWHYFTRAIENRADGSLCFQSLSWWCHNDRCAASSRTNEQKRARICIALIVLTFSRTMIGRLCTIPACYWSNYFGYFRQYRNPGKGASRKNGPYGHPIQKVSISNKDHELNVIELMESLLSWRSKLSKSDNRYMYNVTKDHDHDFNMFFVCLFDMLLWYLRYQYYCIT